MTSFPFRFRFVRGSQPVTLRALHGSVDGHRITLADRGSLALDEIVATPYADARLALVVAPRADVSAALLRELDSDRAVTLAVKPKEIRAVKAAIDRGRAHAALAPRRAALAEARRFDALRTRECPSCEAEIDLTDTPRTPLVACPYCEAVFEIDGGALRSVPPYRACPECGRFDRVQSHNELLFAFALVAYWYRFRRRTMCDACAEPLFVRMLLANLLFVLGVPSALAIGVRTRVGRVPALAGLPRANRLAARGKVSAAAAAYDEVARASSEHPGVLANAACLHEGAGDIDAALAYSQRALAQCGNFAPALARIEGIALRRLS